MSRLADIVLDLKSRIGEGIEPALKFLEQILSPGSDNYNDYIQIKGRYNSLQRELLLGTLDQATYDKARNGISQSLLVLADTLQEDDLKPEAIQPAPSPDKRGEILYRIPDRMQIGHEEKCVVRLAWLLDNLLRDWEKSETDVVKNIRMAEVMGVVLLNVDENNPFAIRTVTEPVQFVDKDDYTEWLFYVKPLIVGSFPLLLRVSVIEMINGKEYKKDIVLEEQIMVVNEEVPPVENFKKADDSLVAGGTEGARSAAAPESSAEGDTSVKVKRNTGKWLGIALSTVALATIGVFVGVPYFREEQAWRGAVKGGQKRDYEIFLSQYPDGWRRQDALDSLRRFQTAAPDTIPVAPVEPDRPDSSAVIAPPPDDAPPPPVEKKKDTRKNQSQTSAPKPAEKPSRPDPLPSRPANPGPTTTSAIPVLSGQVTPFDMSPFSVLTDANTTLEIKFMEFNEKGQSRATVFFKGNWTLKQGQDMTFLMDKGRQVKTRLAYVAQSANKTEGATGYFFMEKKDLEMLADRGVKSIRFQDLKKPGLNGYNLSDGGRRELRQKAKRAYQKLPD